MYGHLWEPVDYIIYGILWELRIYSWSEPIALEGGLGPSLGGDLGGRQNLQKGCQAARGSTPLSHKALKRFNGNCG